MDKKYIKQHWNLMPFYGILLFIILYVTATFLYPGGSQYDRSSNGFSWLHNYWCNLLNQQSMNGRENSARPVAITAMFVLCVSMVAFWYQFARSAGFSKTIEKMIWLSGLLAMGTGFFLFTAYHDMIIDLTGLLAVFAFAGTFVGLYRKRWLTLFWFGAGNILMIGLNNFIYYSGNFIGWLPLVQKISFLTFLIWIALINIGLYKSVYKKHKPLTFQQGATNKL